MIRFGGGLATGGNGDTVTRGCGGAGAVTSGVGGVGVGVGVGGATKWTSIAIAASLTGACTSRTCSKPQKAAACAVTTAPTIAWRCVAVSPSRRGAR